MVFTFTQIIGLLQQYRYFFLFPVVVIEGPIITVIAGFYISLGVFNFILTYIIVVIGDLTGDIFFYYLGRYGRAQLIDRWGRYIGASKERIENLTRKMRQNAGKVILAGKTIEGTGAMVQMAAGMSHLPFRTFLWYNSIPTVIKSLLYLLIGFYFGQAYVVIADYIDYASIIGAAALVVFIIVYLVVKKYFLNKVKID